MSIRILHLISSSGFLGAEHVVMELTRVIKEPDYHSTIGIITSKRNMHLEFYEAVKENELNVEVLACERRLDLGLILRIQKCIANKQIDILHCHGYKANLHGLIAGKGRTKTIATGHLWKTSTLTLKLYCALDSYAIRWFDRITAVSDDVKKEMVERGIEANKIVVIDNGICFETFDQEYDAESVRRELGIDQGVRVIGVIGSLTEEKGHAYLLKAISEIRKAEPNFRLLIVGDGQLRKELEKEVDKLGLKRSVVFTGRRTDIPELLSVIEIFALPSVREGLPMVLLEAMASGKSIVASNVGGVSRAIVNNKTGILIEPGNSEELRRALVEMLRNRKHAAMLGRNARRMAKEKFRGEMMGEKYARIYRELKELRQ